MTDGGGIFFARQQPGWRFQLLRLGLLFFLLVFAVGWAVGAVFAVLALRRHGNHPTVAVFLGAWLLFWVSVPVLEPSSSVASPSPGSQAWPRS